jgi:hypothetical protein
MHALNPTRATCFSARSPGHVARIFLCRPILRRVAQIARSRFCPHQLLPLILIFHRLPLGFSRCYLASATESAHLIYTRHSDSPSRTLQQKKTRLQPISSSSSPAPPAAHRRRPRRCSPQPPLVPPLALPLSRRAGALAALERGGLHALRAAGATAPLVCGAAVRTASGGGCLLPCLGAGEPRRWVWAPLTPGSSTLPPAVDPRGLHETLAGSCSPAALAAPLGGHICRYSTLFFSSLISWLLP